jgi:uncharacterized protein
MDILGPHILNLFKAARTHNAATDGDLAEVERLVEEDPGLVNAKLQAGGLTPLINASVEGHVSVTRLLLDKGAAIDYRDGDGRIALHRACFKDRTPVVRLLLERGADPTLTGPDGLSPLTIASREGHLEVVRVLLGHPSARTTIQHRSETDETALSAACLMGRGGVVRALLEGGADPTIATEDGRTPMAIAKVPDGDDVCADGRRECVAALEVRSWQ